MSILWLLVPVPLQAGDGSFPYVISTEQVSRWVDEGNLRVVDVRRPFPFYFDGHIPGSVRLRWTEIAPDPRRGGCPTDDPSRIDRFFRSAGITSPDVRVVVVGDPPDDWSEAAYLVFALRMYGHERTALVDGGFRKWKYEGRLTSRSFDSPPPSGIGSPHSYSPCLSAEQIMEMRSMEPLAIVDARSRDEFLGARVFGEKRGGHLPGAVHVEWRRILSSDGLIRLDEVRQIFADMGLFPTEPAVIYDSGGVRAAFLWIAMKNAGFERVMLYPDGFVDWSARPDFPIEIGR